MGYCCDFDMVKTEGTETMPPIIFNRNDIYFDQLHIPPGGPIPINDYIIVAAKTRTWKAKLLRLIGRVVISGLKRRPISAAKLPRRSLRERFEAHRLRIALALAALSMTCMMLGIVLEIKQHMQAVPAAAPPVAWAFPENSECGPVHWNADRTVGMRLCITKGGGGEDHE